MFLCRLIKNNKISLKCNWFINDNGNLENGLKPIIGNIKQLCID